jgi:hypothetical protein
MNYYHVDWSNHYTQIEINRAKRQKPTMYKNFPIVPLLFVLQRWEGQKLSTRQGGAHRK